MISFKNFLLLSTLSFLMILAFGNHSSQAATWQDKLGSGNKITGVLNTYVADTASTSRTVAYGAGGLGAVALGALAFFGRFQWGWFFGLIGGLVLITLYNVGVQSVAGDSETPFQ